MLAPKLFTKMYHLHFFSLLHKPLSPNTPFPYLFFSLLLPWLPKAKGRAFSHQNHKKYLPSHIISSLGSFFFMLMVLVMMDFLLEP